MPLGEAQVIVCRVGADHRVGYYRLLFGGLPRNIYYVYEVLFNERDKFIVKYSIKNRGGRMEYDPCQITFDSKKKANKFVDWINSHILAYEMRINR